MNSWTSWDWHMRLGSRNSNVYEIIREKIQPNKKEWNWNIQWTEDLIRNYYNDEEFPVVSYVFIMIVLFMMIIHSLNESTLSYFISKTSIYFPGTMIQIRVIWWWIGMIFVKNNYLRNTLIIHATIKSMKSLCSISSFKYEIRAMKPTSLKAWKSHFLWHDSTALIARWHVDDKNDIQVKSEINLKSQYGSEKKYWFRKMQFCPTLSMKPGTILIFQTLCM